MIFVGYFDISTGIEITFPRDLHAIWSLSQTKLIVTRHKYALLTTLSELRLMLIDVLTFEFNSNQVVCVLRPQCTLVFVSVSHHLFMAAIV